MPAHIGVLNLDGHSAPATGAIQSRTSESSIGAEEEPGVDGNTAYFVSHKYVRKEVEVEGVGDAELSLVTAGKISKGTAKVIRAKQQEFQNALPKFSRTAVVLDDAPGFPAV